MDSHLAMGQCVNRIVSCQRGGKVTVMTAISDQVEVLYYKVHAQSVQNIQLLHNC